MKFKQTLIQLTMIIAVLFTQNKIAFGQTLTDFRVNGIIVDSADQKPLSMITIRLKNANNETVKIAVTKDDGSFKFSAVVPASYSLLVNAIGYGTKVIYIDSAAFQLKTVDLKTIYWVL